MEDFLGRLYGRCPAVYAAGAHAALDCLPKGEDNAFIELERVVGFGREAEQVLRQ